MEEMINFTKMHSIGNDFVIIDRVKQFFKLSPDLIRNISNRHRGIGCDQVLIIDPPSIPNADFEYRIFNQDGSEVEQCGNGARCIGRYVHEKGLINKNYIIFHSKSGLIKVDIRDLQHINASLGTPTFTSYQFRENHPNVSVIQEYRYRITLDDIDREFTFVSLGNPHCIINVPNVHEIDLNTIGDKIQSSGIFPNGTNVTFIEILATNHIKCRVFERHVGETYSCGSAACAAVISGIIKNELSNKVQVDMPGGRLVVNWEPNSDIILSGPTSYIFEGFFQLTPNWL